MNLSTIKNIYQNIPPSLIAPLEIIPFSVFAGSSYREQLQILNTYNNLSIKDKRSYSQRALINFLNDAIRHVPFYENWANKNGINEIKSPADLKNFPIIDKNIVQNDISDFCHKKAKGSYKVTTGGSSGKPLSFFHTKRCYGKEWAFLTDLLKSHNIPINSRRYSLRGLDSLKENSKVELNPLYKELKIAPHSVTNESLQSVWNQIESFGGEWIHGYPSIVYQFCIALEEMKLKLKTVKKVLLISEQVHDFQKKKIEEVLRCEVISFYGMSERVVFAELKNQELIPHPMYGISEIIEGEHVGTGYINDGTVLIRYKTGDKLTGRINDYGFIDKFEQFEGRWSGSSLIGSKGEKINMTILNTHDKAMTDIKNFQFHQEKVGEVTLKIVINSNFKEITAIKIKKLFQKKLGPNFKLKLKIVDKISFSKRGKHQYIISTVPGFNEPN